ncbi:ComEA family DNA-binding protein, partial [Listeria monocytogenes]|nr:ComEA family DNA-binding protein [Listeria monocytogenes]
MITFFFCAIFTLNYQKGICPSMANSILRTVIWMMDL